MLEAPYVMKLAQNLARHAGARQTQISKNIANADVPGYRAREVVDFADTYQSHPGSEQRTTRARHMAAQTSATSYRTYDLGGEASPNGNTVSLEAEMVRAAEAKSAHETALTVYRSSLDILRTSIGRGR